MNRVLEQIIYLHFFESLLLKLPCQFLLIFLLYIYLYLFPLWQLRALSRNAINDAFSVVSYSVSCPSPATARFPWHSSDTVPTFVPPVETCSQWTDDLTLSRYAFPAKICSLYQNILCLPKADLQACGSLTAFQEASELVINIFVYHDYYYHDWWW